MKIEVIQLTGKELANDLAAFTVGNKVNATDAQWFQSEHSPLRSYIFIVKMYGIPSFVSTHLVRHKIGVEHFVRSNRKDRGGVQDANRWTPVDHAMLINGQELLFMARRRLCGKASKETREVMQLIVKSLPEGIREFMIPMCEYRGGKCYEFSSCGRCPSIWEK